MTLSATNISVRFGGIQALDGVSVKVEPGQVVSVIGPNGSGKSTLFNAITGFVTPDTGKVEINGREVGQAQPHQRVRLGIVRTFQTPRIDPDITVLEALKCGLATLPKGGLIGAALATPQNRRDERQIEEAALRVVEELGLSQLKNMPMGMLPMGVVRLVDVGRAAVCQPKFILLDEPAAGLSIDEQDVLKAQIRRLANNGVGVLLVEHNFRFVMELAEHLTVLDQGKMIASGKPELVSKQPEFIRAYLGSIGEDSAAGDAPAPVPESAVEKGSAMRSLLACQDLSARYGSIRVCSGIDLEIREAEVVALLGANGAGKTSLLGALAGIVQADGHIRLGDNNLHVLPAHKRIGAGLALVPEMRGNIFPTLSAKENMQIALRRLEGSAYEEKQHEIFEMFPRLAERLDSPAQMLSGGEQQMLAIAMALAQNPTVLLLDEPTQGLAPSVYDVLEGVVNRITKRGIAVLLAEQNIGFARRLADRVVVLSGGEVSLRGGREELADQDLIMRAYMGLEATGQAHA